MNNLGPKNIAKKNLELYRPFRPRLWMVPYVKFENPEFWYGRTKILVKKKHTPVCETENPEFWYGFAKMLVKKENTLCRNIRPRLVATSSVHKNSKLRTC